MVCAVALGLASDSDAHLYCNGTDASLQTDCLTGTGNVLYYDGFEDGTAVCTIMERNLEANDGWAGKQYIPHASCHPTNGCAQGTSFESLYPGVGCMARSPGAASSNYALWTGQRPSTGREGQTPLMPDHNFNQQVTEFYHRYFIKWASYTNLALSNFKISTTINPLQGSQGAAGIFHGSMRANTSVGGCAGMVQNFTGGVGNLSQNLGNNAHPCADDHWWLIEEHYKQGPAGVYELWMNDCGTSGAVSACGSTQQLRARHTGINIRNTQPFGNLWYEFYSSSVSGTDSYGPIEGYLDEVLVTKTGPNFTAGLSGSPTPPAAPTNVRVAGVTN